LKIGEKKGELYISRVLPQRTPLILLIYVDSKINKIIFYLSYAGWLDTPMGFCSIYLQEF
jgi:hypothetical protein